MIAAVILRLREMPPGPHPNVVFAGVQAVLGTVMGASFSADALAPLAHDWLPIACTVVAVLVVCVIAGQLLAKVTPIPLATAQIGTIPGGAAGMVALSEDVGADVRLVAFMQYLRVILVVLSISGIAKIVHDPGATSVLATVAPEDPGFRAWMLALGVMITGAWIGLRFRIPSGAMIVPLAFAAILGGLGLGPVAVPAWVLPVTYLLLGARIGARFDRDTLRLIRAVFWQLMVFVTLLIAGCTVLGWGLYRVTDIDLLTAMLATSPGGMDAATVAALETGANTPMVVSIQLIRLLVMVMIAPFVVRWLIRPRPAPE
jgi:membrane AbrB-like protein